MQYFHWLAEEFNVDLCTHLWQPRHLAPPRSWTLGHPRLPTLCLLDALAGMGFVVGEACVIEHDPETPRLVFDNRNPNVEESLLPLRQSCSWAFCSWRDKLRKQPVDRILRVLVAS